MMFTDWLWDWLWSKMFEINVIETTSIMVMMLMMMIPHWSSKAYDDPGLLSELGHHRHMLLIWVPWGGRKPDQTISHLRSCLLDLSWFEQQELKRAVSTSCGWKWGAPRGGGALKFFFASAKMPILNGNPDIVKIYLTPLSQFWHSGGGSVIPKGQSWSN